MSGECERIVRIVEDLTPDQQRDVLEYALLLLGRRGRRTTSFLHVPDPMPADEADDFSRTIEQAFETVEPDV